MQTECYTQVMGYAACGGPSDLVPHPSGYTQVMGYAACGGPSGYTKVVVEVATAVAHFRRASCPCRESSHFSA